MLKYDNYIISFAEVPKEISLYITITGCPIKCPLCNSKHLWDDGGKPLTWDVLNTIIYINSGITCVCFGGGDGSPKEINKLAAHIKRSTNLKVCWYSGRETISNDIDIRYFDFIKVGPFNGIPLNQNGTNQIFWKVEHYSNSKFELIDQTKLFQVNDRNNKS